MSTDLEPPPSWTAARARLNALQRHRAADDPEIVAARRDLRAARAADYVRKLVDGAPQLSTDQIDSLAILLRPSK